MVSDFPPFALAAAHVHGEIDKDMTLRTCHAGEICGSLPKSLAPESPATISSTILIDFDRISRSAILGGLQQSLGKWCEGLHLRWNAAPRGIHDPLDRATIHVSNRIFVHA